MKRSVLQEQSQSQKAKVAKRQGVQKSLFQKVQEVLERKPDSFDVSFCVGPEGKQVKAMKILLVAASPVFEREFEGKWKDVENLDSGKAVLLPDFNAEAFQQFVKLTMNDKWTVEGLKDLKEPDQIQKLILICRHYEMKSELFLLEDLLKECYRYPCEASQIPLKTKSEAAFQSEVERKLNPGFSTLCLAMDSRIVDDPPFVCDGNESYNLIATKRNILVHGLSFLGPVDGDCDYDVAVRIENCVLVVPKKPFEPVNIKKRIFAQKGQVFRIMFDKPVEFTKGSVGKYSMWTNSYEIYYSLKGPNTKSFRGAKLKTVTISDGENGFRFLRRSQQLAGILYTNA